MINIDNVSVSYGDKTVLQDINANISEGGITAIIGPNGAGKSTLLSAIARITPIQEGLITLDGTSVFTTPSKELALRLSFMEQDNAVVARLKVRELIEFGRFPHHQGRPGEVDVEEVNKALKLFSLNDIEDRFVETLSGGERQRARAAMCYCQGAQYLLLDEPLNNLDIYYARQLLRTLRHVADTQGRTILIVLHDINQAAHYADRIIALKNGQVVADGPTRKVINTKTLHKIFGFSIPVKTINKKQVCLHFS